MIRTTLEELQDELEGLDPNTELVFRLQMEDDGIELDLVDVDYWEGQLIFHLDAPSARILCFV